MFYKHLDLGRDSDDSKLTFIIYKLGTTLRDIGLRSCIVTENDSGENYRGLLLVTGVELDEETDFMLEDMVSEFRNEPESGGINE